MDINILKTFLEVHRTCHFGNAADNLFVTQATVSARIRQLEDELGVKLFHRDRNNIQLTPAGHKFLRYAESILNIWNRAQLDINVREEGKTPLVIGAIPNLWDSNLVSLLNNIKMQYPDIAIIAEALASDSLIRRLLDQSIDIGFTSDYPQTPGLVTAEACSCDLVMVSSGRDETVESAFRKNYVFVDWGSSFRNEHALLFPDMLSPGIRLGPGYIACDYIRQYGGTAYLPESVIGNDSSEKKLFPVRDAPVINRKSFAVYNGLSGQLDLVKKVIRLVYPDRKNHSR
jgi:DNA-binding transcriptional LysR family regulator